MGDNERKDLGILGDEELKILFDKVTAENGTTAREVLSDFMKDYIVSNGHPEQVVNKWPWNKHE